MPFDLAILGFVKFILYFGAIFLNTCTFCVYYFQQASQLALSNPVGVFSFAFEWIIYASCLKVMQIHTLRYCHTFKHLVWTYNIIIIILLLTELPKQTWELQFTGTYCVFTWYFQNRLGSLQVLEVNPCLTTLVGWTSLVITDYWLETLSLVVHLLSARLESTHMELNMVYRG